MSARGLFVPLVYVGNGTRSHAKNGLGTRTLCGRVIDPARSQGALGEPGCNRCYATIRGL